MNRNIFWKEANTFVGSAIILAAVPTFWYQVFNTKRLVIKQNRNGCMPFGSNNRRHAWDFPSKPDGFKLGGLLERNKRSGFEKLDQNASDEETLSSAKFG